MNQKLNEVRKKQRIKRILKEDLISKGASAHMAQSYVMNMDGEDLTRVEGDIDELEE